MMLLSKSPLNIVLLAIGGTNGLKTSIDVALRRRMKEETCLRLQCTFLI